MIRIDLWEPDGQGGYYIKWTDESQPVTAYIHATPQLMDELGLHHRRERGAPCDNLNAASKGMRSKGMSDTDTVEQFRVAYSELLNDIIDLRERGLKPDTPHAVHTEVRRTGDTPIEWRIDQRPDKFKDFIHKKPKKKRGR